MKATPPFQVLLIGGSSGTGKSVLARQLGQMWAIPALQVDDFRLVLQRVVLARAAGPELWDQVGLRPIFETGKIYADPSAVPEQMCRALIDTAHVMSDAVEIVIAHHVATQTPVIIEGDGLLPSLATRRAVDNLIPEAGQIRAVFLIEEDEARLHASALARRRGFEQGSQAEQRRVIRASWLYGQYLKAEAQQQGLPVLDSQPWDTLVVRAASLLNQA